MLGNLLNTTQSVIEDGKKILQNTSKRWLTACEISRILAFADTKEGGELLCVPTLPIRPLSGSLFVLDYDNKRQKWKEDGYAYERRPNDVGFKEHSERIGDDKKIVCLYSSICDSDPAYDEFRKFHQAEVKFQRRIYRNVDLDPRLLVVHYFMSRKLKKSECSLTIEPCKELNSTSEHRSVEHSFGVDRGSMRSERLPKTPREHYDTVNYIPCVNQKQKPVASIIGSVGCLNYSPYSNNQQSQSLEPILSFWSDKDDESLSGQLGMTVEQSGGEEGNTPSGRSGSNPATINFSKPSLFMTGEERISQLEKQIEFLKQQLEQERSVLSGKSTSLANDSASCIVWKESSPGLPRAADKSMYVQITDFSPEWDYLEGGAKIILCLKVTPATQAGAKALVYFGDYATDGMMIQDNVLRCYGSSLLTKLLLVCSKASCLFLWFLKAAQIL
jgi:CG-1 domain